ncbi:MAG: hypothetical protein K9I36_17055 [Bacteroidia bacterium]|nr:hypothetical protein [Bacteroidia bacterium]
MQDCQFSETQFSFCFTFEYIKQFFPFIPLPIFPNTVEEGRLGGGYDVQIKGNIFFQFKIPVYYDKVSNFWRRDWNVFSHEYYKIKLETDEYQFKLLKDLQCPGNEVFYSTPEFHTQIDLGTYYSTDNIVSHSALFPLDNFPPYLSGYHHLIYSPHHNWGQLFSEPKKIKKIKTIAPFELFPNSKSEMTIYKQAIQLSQIIRSQDYEPSNRFEFNTNRPIQLVKEVYTSLLTDFNTHWYPVIS